MQFRRDRAGETLLNAASSLQESWRLLSEETRTDIRALVREFGPKIALADRQNCVTEIVYILRGLWGLQDRLPAAVDTALRAGAGGSAPGVTLVGDDERRDILAALAQVCDVRTYHRPAALARTISDLVQQHVELLGEDERAAWASLSAAYLRHGDPIRHLDAVAVLFSEVDAIQDVLRRNRTWTPQRGGNGASGAAPDARSAGRAATADSLSRVATAHFPPSVLLAQRRVPLVVHVARSGGAAEGARAALALQPGELTIHLAAEDLALAAVIGGRALPGAPTARAIAVNPDADCEPVVFFLDPQSPGPKRISVALHQDGVGLAILRLETRILASTSAATAEQLSPHALQTPLALAAPSAAGENFAPPDLELRIMLQADGRTLAFMLHSHNGDYNFRPVGRVTLLGEPQAFLDSMLADLSQLARLSSPDRGAALTREALRRINAIGMRLYDELWPDELKREYAGSIRQRYAGKTLLVTSDEPWIPWEMLRPFAIEGGRVAFNDPPLCENFKLSRWLAGRGAPRTLRMGRGLIVAPPGNLPAVRAELDYFAQLQRRKWEIDLRGPVTRVAEVLAEVESGATQWLHLSSHGNFDATDPLASALRLQDGYLRPGQLIGAAQAGIARAAPLVFLNACHAGQNGLTLTRIGGWAETFLSAGAGAFIGSLWEINDRLAAAFAAAFYDALLGLPGGAPAPIAEAFHTARLAIKALDPANPTWLAYVLYAAPATRVTLAPLAA